jgi:hypothetical protein
MIESTPEGKRDMENQRKKIVTDGFRPVTILDLFDAQFCCAMHNKAANRATLPPGDRE